MKKVYLYFIFESDMIRFDGNMYSISRNIDTYVNHIPRKENEKYELVLKSETLAAEEILAIIRPYQTRFAFTFEIRD